MRKGLLFGMIVLIVLLTNCTAVYFKEPQPKGVDALNSFPKSFIGKYESEGDTLYILDTRYIYPEEIERKIPLRSLDTLPEIKIVGDLLYDNSLTDEGIDFTLLNDTVYYKVRLQVSEWLSDSLMLKKFKKWTVLSDREGSGPYWNVYLIESSGNGDLVVYAVKNLKTDDSEPGREYEGSLRDFHSITDFEKIGESEYLINPSKKEFKALIKKGFFKKATEFKRIPSKIP